MYQCHLMLRKILGAAWENCKCKIKVVNICHSNKNAKRVKVNKRSWERKRSMKPNYHRKERDTYTEQTLTLEAFASFFTIK